MKFEIYCDGSTRNNGYANAVGAWAWLVHEGGNVIHKNCGVEFGTTNQRMELTAAVEALDHVCHNYMTPFDKVIVYTDSAYPQNCYEQGWWRAWHNHGWKNRKKQPVAKPELWERLIIYFEAPEVEFMKVKGHAGDTYNEIVDTLAQSASARAKEE